MQRRIVGLASALAVAGILVQSCSSQTYLGRGFEPDAGTAAPSFAVSDDGGDAQAADAGDGLTSYCPSNKCPSGYTTCPSSRFTCDVNLLADNNNCGACGVVCPSTVNGKERFDCVDGRCQMSCRDVFTKSLDCDGIPDNGCETNPGTNDNCGGCGVKCTDPAKPCVQQPVTLDWKCGCPGNQRFCSQGCTDPTLDDQNCGSCGVQCDPTGDGGAPVDPSMHMFYGCLGGQCGQPKCLKGFDNCDGDWSNGCEADTSTVDNCGFCGNACSAGADCRLGYPSNQFQCMCGAGQTFCPINAGCTGKSCVGTCVDTASSRSHCGGCNIECQPASSLMQGVCINGECEQICTDGLADCNGNAADGCEVFTDYDPRNCGGCGIVCDAIAGQACVGGKCVVEPCSPDSPGSTAK